MDPLLIVAIRSQRFIISSSSKETSRIALPLSLSSTMRFLMYSMAPTSRPLVGCAIKRTSGERLISLATITFCWLPPEREPASVTAPCAVLMSNSLMSFSAFSSMALKLSMPKGPEYLSELKSLRARFSATVRPATRPCFLLSSGMWPIPSSMRSMMVSLFMTRPERIISPPATGDSPERA